jgi:hypothetical protein
MLAKISRIRKMLGIELDASDDLDAKLKLRKIPREEKVAGVILTSNLLERCKYTSAVSTDEEPIPVSVPVPLAPPPPPDGRKKTQLNTKQVPVTILSSKELSAIENLVVDVVSSVKADFLVNLLRVPAGGTSEEDRMPAAVRHSALTLLWEVSQLTNRDTADLLEPHINGLLLIIFPGASTPGSHSEDSAKAVLAPPASRTISRVLDIVRNVCIALIVRMNSLDVSLNDIDSLHSTVSGIVTATLHRAVVGSTVAPTAVLHCVIDVYNFHHYYYHRHLVANIHTKPKGDNKASEYSAKDKVNHAVASAHQSGHGLRQLIIQGLHGYASDDVRATALQAAYFLIKEAIDGMRPFSLESSEAYAAYKSMVPVLWTLEPNDGTNAELGPDPDVENTRQTKATKSTHTASSSPPVGQFALFLISIVRTELRLLLQQALATFNDLRDVDAGPDEAAHFKGKMGRTSTEIPDQDALLKISFLCLSIFDKILLLLVGSNVHTYADEDEEDESAIWAQLPVTVLARIRRTVHSIVGDCLEFFNEAAVMIQAQYDTRGAMSADSESNNLRQLCSRIARSLSVWFMEDEELLIPALQGVHCMLTNSKTMDNEDDNRRRSNVILDSILCCSSTYHAKVQQTADTLKIGADATDDDLIGGGASTLRSKGSDKTEASSTFTFHVEGARQLSQILRGTTLYKGKAVCPVADEAERSQSSGKGSATDGSHIGFSRYLDGYDRTNIDVNYCLGQGDCMQFMLPIFLSVTQSESQSYQQGNADSKKLLDLLTDPACEYVGRILKVVQTTIFASRSTEAAIGKSVSRLYSTGHLACDQVNLLLEHFITEFTDSRAEEVKKVLGLPREQWGVQLELLRKGVASEEFVRKADEETRDTAKIFRKSLQELSQTIELLGRIIPIN